MKEKKFKELVESIKHAGEYMRGKRKLKRKLGKLLKPRKLNCVATTKCQINFEQVDY